MDFETWIMCVNNWYTLTVFLSSTMCLRSACGLKQVSRYSVCNLALVNCNITHFFCPLASQSLCQVLDASVNMGSRVLETQLDSLLFALHQQVNITKINT